jgi:hypothetical protein
MQASVRRNTELSLLILGLIVGSGALALVAVARSTEELTGATPLMALIAGCYVAAHIVVRKTAPQADHLLLPVVAVLNSIGLAAVVRRDPRGERAPPGVW